MSKAIAALGVIEAVLIAGSIAIAGGAGPVTTVASDGTPINACALLSDDDVAAAIGKKVTPGERRDDGAVTSGEYVVPGTYSSTCLWRVVTDLPPPNSPDLPLGGASFAILNAMQWPKGSGEAKQFLQSFRDAAKEHVIETEPVPLELENADEAMWWGDGVAIRKGDRSAGISVHIVGARPAQRGMEEELAKKIAARL